MISCTRQCESLQSILRGGKNFRTIFPLGVLECGRNPSGFNSFGASLAVVSPQNCGRVRALSTSMTNGEANNWRFLCELVAKESDPQRLRKLVERLTEALDARAQRLEEQRLEEWRQKGKKTRESSLP